jgi:hypothetical protein
MIVGWSGGQSAQPGRVRIVEDESTGAVHV